MKNTILSLCLAIVMASAALALPQGVADKMKSGVKKVGTGAKDLGQATAEGTKNVAKTVKKKTVRGARRTKRVVKKGVKKVGEGTETTGKAIKKAGTGN